MIFIFQSNCLQCIGDDGNAHGELVLEKVVESVISPPFLRDISWTGKGKGKERKVSLSKFTHLIDFIKSITFKADKTFTNEQFEKKMIYGILKRAPSKYVASSSSSGHKTNVEKSSPNLTKESNGDTVKSTLQSSTTQEQQLHQQPQNHQAPTAHAFSTIHSPMVQSSMAQTAHTSPPMVQQTMAQAAQAPLPMANAAQAPMPHQPTHYPPYQYGHQQYPYYHPQATHVGSPPLAGQHSFADQSNGHVPTYYQL